MESSTDGNMMHLRVVEPIRIPSSVLNLILTFINQLQITRLNQMSLGKTATGQIVNLLSNDVSRYDFVFIFLHSFWIAPIVIAILVYFLWMEIGVSCLAGLLPNILLTIPLQGKLCIIHSQILPILHACIITSLLNNKKFSPY